MKENIFKFIKKFFFNITKNKIIRQESHYHDVEDKYSFRKYLYVYYCSV